MQAAPDTGRLSRRSLLAGAVALCLPAAECMLSPAAATAESSSFQLQDGWRFCADCFVLYLGGIYADSHCPRNGYSGHRAAGWTFKLMYNENTPPGGGEGPNVQGNWRHCYRCATLYWALSTSQRCPSWGAHAWGDAFTRQQYLLSHDLGQPSGSQNQWRYCVKCSALFFNGYAYKGEYGLCPYDDIYGHTAAGYDFVLAVSAYT
ncbi:hypothetical protein [Nonomuraea sp. SBT364]|uniref:hypothetical protein n=1 Tax=Nonomuraea sp. SBT364 TaxID=1580530 RepID=UPI0012E1CA48|nr:hypothetical protein [Nonomuraea sp. SBT364]